MARSTVLVSPREDPPSGRTSPLEDHSLRSGLHLDAAVVEEAAQAVFVGEHGAQGVGEHAVPGQPRDGLGEPGEQVVDEGFASSLSDGASPIRG